MGLAEPPEISATNQALGSSRKIFDYRVAYFFDTRNLEEDIVSPETIQRLTGAVIINSREAFQEYQQSGQPPIQVALIHSSMFKRIDREWARAAYRDGTVIFVGIDMPYHQLGDLVGNNCISMPDGADLFEQVKHSYFYLTYLVSHSTSLSETELIERHHRQLELCKSAGFGEGWGQSGLSTEADYGLLLSNLNLQALYYFPELPIVVDPERTAEATIPG